MKRPSSPDDESRRGLSPDKKLAGFVSGILRRHPHLPKVILWLVTGLILAGLMLSFF